METVWAGVTLSSKETISGLAKLLENHLDFTFLDFRELNQLLNIFIPLFLPESQEGDTEP